MLYEIQCDATQNSVNWYDAIQYSSINIHGINWEDHVRNEDIREEVKLKPISVRKRRLRWFGHVHRQKEDKDIRKLADLKILYTQLF